MNADTSSGDRLSLWNENVRKPKFDPLAENLEADVCVIGAGIAGLSVAYLAAREGFSAVVLEDGEVGSGETGRTSAHLSNALDDRYYELERYHGSEGARLAAESHAAAIDRIESIAQQENIDCEFERLDGYLFNPPDGKFSELVQEYDAAMRAGIQVTWADRAPFPSFDSGRCLRFPRQAQFHPLKYLYGLAGAFVRAGGMIYTMTHAAAFDEGSPTDVKTKSGFTVKARHLVVATNTPISTRVAIHIKQAAYRSYVIGARIPKGSVTSALFWDTPDPYHYVRAEKGQNENDILIVGGEDHKTGQADDGDERFQKLETWARERFPVQEVQFRWSGQIIEPADGLAFIGRISDKDNVYIVTGDSGNGLTHGTIAGILITDLIAKRENPWASLYDPNRKTIKATPEMAKENLNVVPQYADWIKPGEVKSRAEIAAGEGAVIRDGLARLAVFKDEAGGMHECSAVCPHLGCSVRWNGTEKTWDCPCHGSRFDPYGKVMNGPALTDLKPVGVVHQK